MLRLRPHEIDPLDADDYTTRVPDGDYAIRVANGKITGFAPQTGGGGAREAVFKLAGTVGTGVGVTRLYNDTDAPWTIQAVRATVETAPIGGSVVVDVNKNDTTIFTTQANRPKIVAGGSTSGKVTAIDVTTVAAGDYLTIDVDTTAPPAANLTVILVIS